MRRVDRGSTQSGGYFRARHVIAASAALALMALFAPAAYTPATKAATTPTTKPKGTAIRSTPATKPVVLAAAEIKKIDGASVKATLRGLRGGKLVFDGVDGKAGGPESELSLEDVSEIIPPAPAKPAATTQETKGLKCEVVLASEDRLHGVLAAWGEKQWSLATPLAAGGTLSGPVALTRELWFGTPDQVKQAKAVKLEPGPEDAAFVVKDSAVVAVRGIAMGIEGESLQFKFNDQVRKIGVAKLVGVVLGGQEAKRDDSFRQAVQLADGDVVSGTWTTLDKNVVGLETSWGGKVQIPFASVARVSGINGRLVYVSDLKPSRVEQVPYFDRLIPWRPDHSLTGGTIKLTDGDYTKGLAVHSRCVLEYEIGGKFETFAAKVGFQQPEGRLGRAVVRVLGDGQTLYEDLDARGDAAKPAEVSVKVAAVNRLTLEVDFGKDEDTGDRVVWANARLLRAAKK